MANLILNLIFNAFIKSRNNMLEIEDSQEFVWEIVDELFGNAMRIVYDNYIKSQTIPYMINEARKAILHIIEVINK